MPQFLFIVEVPPMQGMSTEPHYPREWSLFESEASTILTPVKACKRLQLNAWLLPAENILPVLLSMSAACTAHHLAYSALLVSGEVTPLTLPKK